MYTDVDTNEDQPTSCLKDQTSIQDPKSKIKNPSWRLITAVIVLPFLIASILISWLQPLFVGLAAAAMVAGLFEFYVLAKRRDLRPDPAIGYLAAAALFTVFYFNEPSPTSDFLMMQMIPLILIVFTAATMIAITLRGAPFDKMIASSGATILGVLYVVLLGGHLVAVRTGFNHALSSDLLSFFFLVLMGSDTGAYYTGRALGEHKMAPSISPGKTWEGLAGGVLAGGIMATIAHFWFFRELPLKLALPLAAVMIVVGILGDLTESALKRSANAKDAANILPGHGGLLDRLDSLLFNAPVIYYFGRLYFNG
jgi:phosphatidate cytidylyltransferase